MEFRRVSHSSPEQVFVVVRNSDAATMSSGYAAMWSLPLATDSVGQRQDGFAVRLPSTDWATPEHPGLFAGVVANRDIQPEDFGRIQVYGPILSVVLNGTTGVPFAGAATGWNATSVSSLILRPVHAYASATAITAGFFGVVSLSADLGTYLQPLFPGGYAVPFSRQFTTVSTDGTWTSGTLGSTGTGWCKAFIRCL